MLSFFLFFDLVSRMSSLFYRFGVLLLVFTSKSDLVLRAFYMTQSCFCNVCVCLCFVFAVFAMIVIYDYQLLCFIHTFPHTSVTFSTGKMDSINFEQSSSLIVNRGTDQLHINCSHEATAWQLCCGTNTNRTVGLWVSLGTVSSTVKQKMKTMQFKDRFQLKKADMTRGSLIIHPVNPSDWVFSGFKIKC